ncbi:hypothetical protein GCM10009127_12340 [Alteraurantiacibacter aestuarii]|nr:hypothetical protein [Alteraurantiacibacter aestuarii]
MPRPKKAASPFRYFNSSPEVIRLVVMMYVRFPLSLRNVEDLLFERGIDICHEAVRHWWNRFGPLFAADVQRQRASRCCQSKCTQPDLSLIDLLTPGSESQSCANFKSWYLAERHPFAFKCICFDSTF